MPFELLLGPLGLSSFGGTVVPWLFVLVYFWFRLCVTFVIWFVSVSFLCNVVLGVCVIAFVLEYIFPEEPCNNEHCIGHYYTKLYFHLRPLSQCPILMEVV